MNQNFPAKTTLTVRAVNSLVISIGYRKGLLPLQTIETEANGDSRSTCGICPSLACFLGGFCPALTALVDPDNSTKYLLPQYTISLLLSR
jgi:hypothetical protein